MNSTVCSGTAHTVQSNNEYYFSSFKRSYLERTASQIVASSDSLAQYITELALRCFSYFFTQKQSFSSNIQQQKFVPVVKQEKPSEPSKPLAQTEVYSSEKEPAEDKRSLEEFCMDLAKEDPSFAEFFIKDAVQGNTLFFDIPTLLSLQMHHAQTVMFQKGSGNHSAADEQEKSFEEI
ncbi:MAG: hypothetical protein AAGI90_05425 [Chlamydiota bacterium]